jgi:hypothetical protein
VGHHALPNVIRLQHSHVEAIYCVAHAAAASSVTCKGRLVHLVYSPGSGYAREGARKLLLALQPFPVPAAFDGQLVLKQVKQVNRPQKC